MHGPGIPCLLAAGIAAEAQLELSRHFRRVGEFCKLCAPTIIAYHDI